MLNRKKLVLGGAMLAGTGGFAYWYFHHIPHVPTKEEFFSGNPHLKAPVEILPPEVDELRTSNQFKDGDFKLRAGQRFSLKFNQSMRSKAQKGEGTSLGSDGEMVIDSLGILNGRLKLIVEFKIQNHKETKSKKVPKTYPLSNVLLLGLQPDGKLRELHASVSRPDFTAIGNYLNLIETSFKAVAPIAPGRRVVAEPDPGRRAYPVSYEITELENDKLKINISSKLDSLTGGSESRAAATGVAGLGNILLHTVQDQKLDWTWLKKEQRPEKQEASGTMTVSFGKETLASVSNTMSTTWKDISPTADLKDASLKETHKRAELLKYPVDLAALRAFMNNSNTVWLGKKGRPQSQAQDWYSITSRLSMANADKLKDHDMKELMLDLSNQIKSSPKLIQAAKSMAKSFAPGSRGVTMLMGAIAYEGGPEAQSALIELFNRPNATHDEKQKVVFEFAMAHRPLTEETKTFIKEQYQVAPLKSSISNSAGLAIGTSISLDGDPKMITYVHEQWRDNKTILGSSSEQEIDKKEYLLSVMGNSKSNVFETEIAEAASSSRTDLRQGAANASRFAQDTTSRDRLFNQFIKDPSAAVRRIAYQALEYQPFDERTRTALQDCSIGDSDKSVKIQCYKILGYRIQSPGIRDFLNSRQGAEKDEVILNAIGAALSIKKPDNQ